MAVPTKQTAVQVSAFDPANYLEKLSVTTDLDVPSPGPGEVLLNIKLRPVNPADVFSVMGVYPAFNQAKVLPCVPGMEGMGVVAKLGEGCSRLSVGQRATAALWPNFPKGNGLYQEYVCVPEEALTVVPDDISDDAAACAVINPVSVLGMLDEVGPVPEDGYIAVVAAGSALSKMVISLCKDRGIKTIGLVRRREQFDEILALGATAMVCLSDEDVVARVYEITGGKGAYATLECCCGSMTSKACQMTRERGTVVLYGGMEGATCTLGLAETLFKGVRVQGYWCNVQLLGMTREQREEYMHKIFDLFRRGIFESGKGPVMPLSQAVEAFKLQGQTGRPGKILLQS